MKLKITSVVLAAILSVCSFASCSFDGSNITDTSAETEQTSVADVTTKEDNKKLTRTDAENILKDYITINGSKKSISFKRKIHTGDEAITEAINIDLKKAIIYSYVETSIVPNVSITATVGYSDKGLLTYAFEYRAGVKEGHIIITNDADETYALYINSSEHIGHKIAKSNKFNVSFSGFNYMSHSNCRYGPDCLDELNIHIRACVSSLTDQLSKIDPLLSASLIGLT